MLATSAAMLFSLLLAATPAIQQEPGDLLIRADRIVIAPDTVLENGSILIRNGAVLRVGSEIPLDLIQRARTLQFTGTVVPGFVQPHSYLGQEGDLTESVSAFTPDLKAVDAFDPYGENLSADASYGITCQALAPLSANTFAGIGALVKPGVDGGTVLNGDGYLKLALVSRARGQDRYPTSLMGATDLVRLSFQAAGSPLGAEDPDLEPQLKVLQDCILGSRKLFIHASTHAEITAALNLCEEFSLVPCLLGAEEAEKSLERIRRLGATLVLSPLHVDDKESRLQLPARLEQAGIPFSFTALRAGDQRVSAALAVRYGMSRPAALAALTRIPAEQCDAAAAVGSLREGCHADFLVFSGDPLDLSSRLEAVFINGRRIDIEEKKR